MGQRGLALRLEFSQASFDSDSDTERYGHLSRDLVTGANPLTKAVPQVALLSAASIKLLHASVTMSARQALAPSR